MMRWFIALVSCSVLAVGAIAPINAQDDEKLGAIEITSPSGESAVFIEGFRVGTTPMKMTGIPRGNYRIVVKRANAGDFVHDVTLAEGESASVAATVTTAGWSSPVRSDADWKPVSEEDQKHFEKAEATKKLGGYKRIELANFLAKSEDVVPPGHLFALFGAVLEGIDDRKKLKDVVLATNYSKGTSTRWVATPGTNEPTLILSGAITRYQGGSRAQRYVVGFGAGRTRLFCLFRLVDKQTGDVLLERMENGTITGGFFGGSSSGAVKQLGQDIAKVIERNW